MVDCFIRHIQPLHVATPDVIGFRCQFSLADYQPQMMQMLPPSAQPGQQAVAKRQAEFLAGRLCARACLEKLGTQQTWISIGSHRSPCWPEGIRGSITHTDQNALCICSASPSIVALGIDLEQHLSPDTADDIAAQVLTREEQALLSGQKLDAALFVTRVFSAKEAIFKALYPYVQAYFGFEAVSLRCIEGEYLGFVLNKNLHPDYQRGQSLWVQSLNENTHILSLLIQSRSHKATSGVFI
ncbi:4'-phosphopantetheinyl transferase family protein [Bowmanella denitrificans]|uniref:4'-phosphopantetheinyl transferase family protein n=1 Tax=Bowmanella denitrificans TaxID=366582 RepID=UPI000C99FB39|nr:4'-phosphopantetheinyl transferase superfamily protein [Bowmanella denitrificans]